MSTQRSSYAQPDARPHTSYMRAVEQLYECYMACEKLFTVNVPKEAGFTLSYLHLKRLQACSEICDTTARYLLKDGIKAAQLCEITSHICEQTADSCDQVVHETMQAVAEICRETARICIDESYRIKKTLRTAELAD